MSLAKVTFIKTVGKEHVVMDYGVAWHHVMSSPWWCVCALYFEQSVTLARLRCNHPDDGRRPKHVGAVLI